MRRLWRRDRLLVVAVLVLLPSLASACNDTELERCRADASVEHQNAALVRRVFDELNQHNAAVYQDLFAPEYGWHFPAGNSNALTRDQEAEFVKLLWNGFPDTHWDIDELIASGEQVVVRFTFKGTHNGEYQGLAPTGRSVAASGIWMARISNGQVVAVREEADVLGWMQQLGMELRPSEPPTN